MKRLTYIFLLALLVMGVSCTPEETVEHTLPVNAYNLDGTWQLAELNEAPLADSTYLYIVLNRKGTFSIYDNLGSMYPVLSTGTFSVEKEWRDGDIISGVYDNGLGAWNYDYIITDFCEESMLWTAKGNPADKQKFVRVAEVPADIEESVRKD
jgi:hypothetical protein